MDCSSNCWMNERLGTQALPRYLRRKTSRAGPSDPWVPVSFPGCIWKGTMKEGEASLSSPAVLSKVWLGM